MRRAELWFESGESSLEVRHLQVREALDELFRVEVVARSPLDALELSLLVGRRAALSVDGGFGAAFGRARVWSGLCVAARQLRSESTSLGLSTYAVTIVPALWLLTQRRTQRLFQHVSIPDIVDAVLGEWALVAHWELDRKAFAPLALRTQYDETDYDFVRRLLEEAGITLTLEDAFEGARIVLRDAPAKTPSHLAPMLTFVDDPSAAAQARVPFATRLTLSEQARPGAVILRDYDPTNPRYPLYAGATDGLPHEQQYEQYRYVPGAFLREGMPASDTPIADDRGVARYDAAHGERRARVELDAIRSGRRVCAFETNVLDTSPGSLVTIAAHPRPDLLAPGLIVRSFELEGTIEGEWTRRVEAVPTTDPIRPARRTPRPVSRGVQIAVVVGPEPGSVGTAGEPMRRKLPGTKDEPPPPESIPADDVYTDEYGRVRVQFPWDREHHHAAESSIWIRVAQSWAGPGHGVFSIPRIGTEVVIGYVDGDLDVPIVVGALHNMVSPAPYKLPDNRSVTTWRSATSPGREGSNELRFDDTAGREHLYLQAQQDMDHLVKNDKQEAVGRDRAAFVQRDETRAVGHNLLDVIKTNAVNVVGASATAAVGLARSTTVGVEDSTTVGSRWSVTVARGLSATLGPKLASVLDGALGSVLGANASAVLGRITSAPLGGVEGGAAAALAAFRAQAPQRVLRALGVGRGTLAADGPPPTTIEVVDRRIELTTGEASIILDGPNIAIRASGNIVFDALKSVTVAAEEELALAAREQIAVVSLTDDVVVQAAQKVKLNPFDKAGASAPAPRVEPKATSDEPEGDDG